MHHDDAPGFFGYESACLGRNSWASTRQVVYFSGDPVRVMEALLSLESLERRGTLLKECRYSLYEIVGCDTHQKHVVFGGELICQFCIL